MSKLDDLFGKKKDVVPVLDLSKSVATNKEELKRIMEKVPDYKMRPIKVRQEDIKIKDKDWGFKCPKKETKYLLKHNGDREKFYTYLDPIPSEMRGVVIMDLCPVPIDWKMLTTLRPRSKLDEDYFSKLVELGKLQLKSEQRDKRDNFLTSSSNMSANLLPTQSVLIASSIRKVKNKSGIIEKRPVTCLECSEEFCFNRGCSDFNYDLYVRVPTINQPAPIPKAAAAKTMDKKKSKSLDGGKKVKKSKVKGKFKRQDTNVEEKIKKSPKKGGKSSKKSKS